MRIQLIDSDTELQDADMITKVANYLRQVGIRTLGDLVAFYNECGDYKKFQKAICNIHGLGPRSANYLYFYFLSKITIKHY